MPAVAVTGPLLRITYRFFPGGGRNRRPYTLHLSTEDGQAEWAWVV